MLKFRAQHTDASRSFRCSIRVKVFLSSDVAEQVMTPTALSSLSVIYGAPNTLLLLFAFDSCKRKKTAHVR